MRSDASLRLLRAMFGALLACGAGAAPAAFPERPVRLIVPLPPGSALDVVARTLGDTISKKNSAFVFTVDNRPGAGSIVGADQVAKATPDGHTLLMGTSSTFAIAPSLYRQLAYNPVKDFSPISLIATFPQLVLVRPSLKATTLPELLALAKAQPGKLNFGSSGNGGIGHLAPGGVIKIGRLECATAIVDPGVDIDDLELLVQQLDGGQDAVTVQPARVQVIGFEVGGGHKAHAMLKQRVEQAVQDHGVGDVSDMKFVKANQLEPLGHANTEFVQRIDRALQISQFAVHFAHELMEMQTGFAFNRDGIEKAVHQKAFAATDPTI